MRKNTKVQTWYIEIDMLLYKSCCLLLVEPVFQKLKLEGLQVHSTTTKISLGFSHFKKENVESFTLLFTALGGADCFINYLILFV